MTTDTDETREAPGSDATIQQLLSWVGSHGYSGLTDAQIEQVVAYRAQVIAQGAEARQRSEQLRQQHERQLRQAELLAQEMRDSLTRAQQLRPAFEVVGS